MACTLKKPRKKLQSNINMDEKLFFSSSNAKVAIAVRNIPWFSTHFL